MAHAFRRTRRGLRAKLEAPERELLLSVASEVHDLLTDPAAGDVDPLAALVGIGTATRPPQDPALARLLPDAYPDDPEAASEFRRYTELGLRDRKQSGLRTLSRTLERPDPLVLTDDEARVWAVALTDVRLALASRMGLEREEDHERLAARSEQDDLLDSQLITYDFLTWLQESLVVAMADPADRNP